METLKIIAWILLGLTLILILFAVAVNQDKKKKRIKGKLILTNKVYIDNVEPFAFTYFLTDEALINCQYLTIKYYQSYKQLRYIGRLDQRSVVLEDPKTGLKKFYQNYDVYPCKFDDELIGYLKDGVFYVTKIVKPYVAGIEETDVVVD
jgi:hypothetical protein